MVSLVATAEPNATPPRVRLDLATGVAGQTFTSIAVRRNGVLLREQPYAGGETALGYDYEAPFGAALTYTAEVVSSAWTTRRNETWSSLTGWTTTGTVSVSGGRLAMPSGAASVARTLTYTTPARLIINNPSQWSVATSDGAALEIGHLSVTVMSDGSRVNFRYGGASGSIVTDGPNTAPVTLALDEAMVTATWGDVTRTLPRGSATAPYYPGLRVIRTNTTAIPYYVGSFLIEGGSTIPATLSSSTQLDSDSAWLTHIVAPGLSMPVHATGNDANLFLEQGSAWSKTSKAIRSMHYPLGRRRPIIVTSGPRAEYEFAIDVHAPTFALRHDLDDLLADQTPLLLRSPAGYDWDIPDDWYSVGDVEVKRKAPAANYEGVTVSLPLTPVDPPVLPQGSVRTYGDLLGDAGTYAGLVDLYDTYTELLAGGAA